MATVALDVQTKTGQPPRRRFTTIGGLSSGDDYTFPNDGRTKLRVTKGAGSASVLTFVSRKTVNGLDVEDPTVTVATGGSTEIGPFSVDLYGTTVAISGITNEANVSLAVYRD